jgi:diacylglycerol kinase (ATP)
VAFATGPRATVVKISLLDLVLNTNARLLRTRPGLVHEIRRLAAGRAEVFVTEDLEQLEAAARAIAERARAGDRSDQRVVLCGGDGTLMAGVTALESSFEHLPLPEIVLAPAGTVATVARNWGQTRGVLETVRGALDGKLGHAVLRPTLRVTDNSGPSRIGFTFGTGLVARFFDRYYSAGAGGYRTAARIVARVFVGSFVSDDYSRSVLDPLPCVLRVDGVERPPPAYSLIVASVIRDVGLHLLVTHRGGEDPDRPHLVAAPLSPRELGPQAPRVFLGRSLKGEGCFDGLVRSFSVRFSADSGPYVLDGDVFHAREVEVRAGPRIRVITA